MLHLDFTNYNVCMADYIINLWRLYRMCFFFFFFFYFKCNSLLSVKSDVTFAQGIMAFWNISADDFLDDNNHIII